MTTRERLERAADRREDWAAKAAARSSAALVERAESAAAGVVIDYFCDGRIARVTFAEKPEREILTALKAAGYRWQKCCWSGEAANLPEIVREMAE